MDISFQSSMIMVSDIGRSRRFYEELLGQKILLDHGRAVGYVGGFAIMEADYAFQVIHGHALSDKDKLGSIHSEFYFETRDLDAVLKRVNDAGVRLVHKIRTQPWGQRVFRILDPDGYMLEFGELMDVVITRLLKQGKTQEEVAEFTSMPSDIVRKIAESLPPSH